MTSPLALQWRNDEFFQNKQIQISRQFDSPAKIF